MSISQNKLQTLKGFRDFLPNQEKNRQWLITKLEEIFELWGFEPISTPTIEYLSLFEGQIGEDEKMFFKFKDQGDRSVALRYDQTVPTCRILAQYKNQITLPFKRYQIQQVFRAEKPQKGRYREFLQADADIFGSDSPIADAEVIALSLSIYQKLGFKNFKVMINDRELLKSIPYKAITAIDKIKKVGRENVIKEMVSKGMALSEAKNILSFVENLKPNPAIEIILKYLKNSGFPNEHVVFEPTLARSFAYSSGPIWEVVIPEYESGSVLGGERYDNIIESISKFKIPATGFAVGFDRTLEAAEILGIIPDIQKPSQVLIAIFDPNLLTNSVEVAKKFREKQISTEIYPSDKVKLGKQIKYANDKKIPFMVIIGPDEVKNNKIRIKNMLAREEQCLSLPDAIEYLINNK